MIKKTDKVLVFDAEKVIWIFTKSKKVMIATEKAPWLTINWNKNFELIDNQTINIQELLDK